MKNIGILGCGWLGYPLAKELLKDAYNVYGSTTSQSKIEKLENDGIKASKIIFFEDKIEGDIITLLKPLDIVIINIPPRLRGKIRENFIKKMTLLHAEIKKTKCSKIIFISSTAVYGNVSGTVTEESKTKPNTESGKQLLVCEKLFLEDPELQTTIIRFGGLIGPDRHPVTMLSGKENLTNGHAPVNLIHLQDCISIIKTSISKGWWNVTMNAVHPLHPTKKEYYAQEALLRGIKPPKYITCNEVNSKKVDSTWLINVKKYHFHTSIYS